MSLSPEQIQIITDMCDLRDIGRMCGLTLKEASDRSGQETHDELVRLFDGSRRKSRPLSADDRRSGPRVDWSKATPRLPERDWLALRGSIIRRDGRVCTYCGDKPETPCVDHVLPLSRGGTNDPSNLVVACMPCNSSKGFKLLSEWRGRYQ